MEGVANLNAPAWWDDEMIQSLSLLAPVLASVRVGLGEGDLNGGGWENIGRNHSGSSFVESKID